MAKLSMIAKAKRKPKFAVRAYTRCRLCGRPRAYMRKFEMCRICFRKLALAGEIPGRDQGELVGAGEVSPMNMTDPIADMITRIRNGVRARLPKIDVPASRLKTEIARILKDEGYIANYRYVDDGRQGAIRIFLKYGPGWERVITDLQRVSKPGCRIYCGKGEIPRVYGGLGINILSTSRGVMTGREAAKTGVGGEILCNVW